MIRTQIQLTEEQAKKARQAADRLGLSMAEVIRRALDDALAAGRYDPPARKRALRVIGRVRSGTGDLSVNHDKYLEDSYSE